MKRNAIVVLCLLALGLTFCGKGKEPPPPQFPVHERNVAAPAPRADAEKPLRVRQVDFSPAAPTAVDDVTAAVMLFESEADDVAFNFQWFVDGREIVDAGADRLDKTFFKKGSWLYCRVQAVSGSRQSEWFKSGVIRVFNSLPALRLEPLADFSIPGDIRYQAAASDPDGDELNFEVLSPLEQGIVMDARTGALSWHLSEEMVKNLGENIVITIAVSDGEGEKVTGTITLNLTSTKK